MTRRTTREESSGYVSDDASAETSGLESATDEPIRAASPLVFATTVAPTADAVKSETLDLELSASQAAGLISVTNATARGGTKDMRLTPDFDGVGGGNIIKNAFWKARYDGTLELLDVARAEMARRVAALETAGRIPPKANYWVWPVALVNLAWDVKKLHDNLTHADADFHVDVAAVRRQLERWPRALLAPDERRFILSGLDALVAQGAVREPAGGAGPDNTTAGGPPPTSRVAPHPAVDHTLAPVTIHYIANTPDIVIGLERALTFGEVVGGSIKELVDAVIAKANGHPIGILTITGHGMRGSQELGDRGDIDTTMSASELIELGRLHRYFAPGAQVVLHGCEVAAGKSGERLLHDLASLWRVQVRAGVSYQRLPPGLEGTEVSARAEGEWRVEMTTHESALNELSRVHPDPRSDGRAAARWQSKTLDAKRRVPFDARYDVVIDLISGYTTENEGEIVLDVFQTASRTERRELYRLIEGHAWAGDFKHGWLADDDGLYNSLTTAQLARLRSLLNE